ncbi:MAG: DUF1800 domain-containing protein [Candidatus Hydrogenedentes bacterium]|nr:DUF1800 domain-containing protein [Candidatus Hydrogenedentota bacterium]
MASLHPIGPESWSLASARHLLNRAGFGVPHSLAVRLSEMAPEAAVDHLLGYENVPFAYPEPDFLIPALTQQERRAKRRGLGEEERRALQQEEQRKEREALRRLQAWWIQRMRVSPRPLEEKMALFWHGHFATSAQKVRASQHNYELLEVFRRNATGNFRTLVTHVGQSPCMLRYLDNDRSTKQKPNENWARELMELFTLGQGQYTEEDIKEAARAFTGWSSDGRSFQFRRQAHDSGAKTVFGRTGNFDGADMIDILFEQEALAPFICGKLWKFFASENPDPDVVAALASTFRESSFELKPVLRQIFLSEAFHAPEVVGSQIKSPAQFVVKLTHDLALDTVPPVAMVQATARLGQDLLHPPNVKGWDGNRAWINANTLLIRYNLPADLASAATRGHNQRMAGGGDAMMMAPAGADPELAPPAMTMTPAEKKAAEDPRAALREQIREKLKGLPREERQFKLKILRTGNPAQRRALLKELGLEAPAEYDPLSDMFEGMTFTTAGECIAQLAERLIGAPLAHDQRQTLLQALGVPDAGMPVTPENLPDQKRNELLHLMTSLAEYQLC